MNYWVVNPEGINSKLRMGALQPGYFKWRYLYYVWFGFEEINRNGEERIEWLKKEQMLVYLQSSCNTQYFGRTESLDIITIQ